jgi:ABC-type sugar transport system ATPase subunit
MKSLSQLRVENLAKRYKSRTVLKDLSLEIRSGEVVGLLGPNGAGKTTAFYMIVGLVKCDDGHIWLDDQEVTDLPMHRRAQLGLGYLPQEPSVFRKLSVEDNIRAVLELRNAYPQWAWTKSIGRRAPPRRNCACAGDRATIHPAGRAICRGRPHFCDRYSAYRQTPKRSWHRGTHYRPQCP